MNWFWKLTGWDRYEENNVVLWVRGANREELEADLLMLRRFSNYGNVMKVHIVVQHSRG